MTNSQTDKANGAGEKALPIYIPIICFVLLLCIMYYITFRIKICLITINESVYY